MAKKRKRRLPLRLEVPFTSEAPQLTSEAVGLPRLMRRAAASNTMDATILDAVDGRLLRDGVVVAHRVIGGLGEWYLAAPKWAPALPEERIEPLGANGDLPEVFARLLRPLVRGAVLGPIAALRSQREEWALRNTEGEVAALVKDERVTLRRGGVATARYREITITPTRDLTGHQREFLVDAARAVNATIVDEFPSIQQRIGAPATGLTNFPEPPRITREATLEEFVTAVFAGHLSAIVRADLARRASGSDDLGELNALLWAFGKDLRGLAPVLDPSWREPTERLLAGLPFATAAEFDPVCLQVIDALAGAVLAPRLGGLSQEPAAALLFERAEQATLILADRCRALEVSSEESRWQGALRAAEQLDFVATVAAPLYPKAMGKLVGLLEEAIEDLRDCALGPYAGSPDLDGLSAAQAYQLGVDTERARAAVAKRRAGFIAAWPGRVTKATSLLAKARKW